MSNPATLNIGKKITGQNQTKDAIHMAIAPVKAGATLTPGQHVTIADGLAVPAKAIGVGIVDPFLAGNVQEGDEVWLFLYPGSITGLRHEWSHPCFPAQEARMDDKAYSERWLREYALRLKPYEEDDPDGAYQNLLSDLRNRELLGHGTDLHGSFDLEDADTLFRHAEVILGQKFDISQFTFSCSC